MSADPAVASPSSTPALVRCTPSPCQAIAVNKHQLLQALLFATLHEQPNAYGDTAAIL